MKNNFLENVTVPIDPYGTAHRSPLMPWKWFHFRSLRLQVDLHSRCRIQDDACGVCACADSTSQLQWTAFVVCTVHQHFQQTTGCVSRECVLSIIHIHSGWENDFYEFFEWYWHWLACLVFLSACRSQWEDPSRFKYPINYSLLLIIPSWFMSRTNFVF